TAVLHDGRCDVSNSLYKYHFSPFKISVIPLAERDMKTVHVVIFSEKVRNQDVGTWLSRYWEVFNGTEVVDIDGIKTGTRRFQVRLRRRDGALEHLPSSIQLGAFRGAVFYPGQPKECRKCGSLQHLASECTQIFCKNCKATDHSSLQCSIPLKCNLCSSTKHKFKDCPQAYANRVKLSTTPLLHSQNSLV
uniref:CCHC-type domain-containing protein n=1 Tax=Anabas testudineus TaxID=64144 RepID=A0A3Q1IRK8_ANATE